MTNPVVPNGAHFYNQLTDAFNEGRRAKYDAVNPYSADTPLGIEWRSGHYETHRYPLERSRDAAAAMRAVWLMLFVVAIGFATLFLLVMSMQGKMAYHADPSHKETPVPRLRDRDRTNF